MTKYVWNPNSDNILLETDDAGDTTVVYTQEPGLYGNLISQRRAGQTSYYHFDALGSTRALTDENENVTDTYLNDAWGVEKEHIGTTVNSFRWVGEKGYYTDHDTEELYIRGRNYRPSIARWTSEDALTSFGRYVYASNVPIQITDPSGLLPACPNLSLRFGAFIPNTIGQPVYGLSKGLGLENVSWFTEPGQFDLFAYEVYAAATDNRNGAGGEGTSRVFSVTNILPPNAIGDVNKAGANVRTESSESHRLKYTTRLASAGPPSVFSWHYVTRSLETETEQPRQNVHVSSWKNRCFGERINCTAIAIEASGKYPFVKVSPKINYEFRWTVCLDENTRIVTNNLRGQHNEFPAYEAVLGDRVIYTWFPTASGPGIFNLGVFTENFAADYECMA